MDLDELAHAGPEHLDPAYVEGYHAKTAVDPAEDIQALRRHGLEPGWTLVDFGAGTGEVAIAAARHCRRVVAVEVSPAMLFDPAEAPERLDAWLAAAPDDPARVGRRGRVDIAGARRYGRGSLQTIAAVRAEARGS